jgi:hypothetical protein
LIPPVFQLGLKIWIYHVDRHPIQRFDRVPSPLGLDDGAENVKQKPKGNSNQKGAQEVEQTAHMWESRQQRGMRDNIGRK